MGALANVAGWGGASILVGIIGVLSYLWLSAERRHTRELDRVNRDHDTELAELRAQRAELRAEHAALRVEHAELHTELDAERRRRWHAEDTAAEARRGAGDVPGGGESAHTA